MRCRATKLVPKWCRIGIRRLPVLSQLLDKRAARRYASTTKRLDECLREFSEMHRATGFTPQDRVCVEIGAGWVLSHALAMHVLGARSVISTDVDRVASLDALASAIGEADGHIDWESLACMGDIDHMRSRLEQLLSIRPLTFDKLADLGIEYIAPIHLSERPLGRPVDFVFSHAVMEHVPVDCVLPLLTNLVSDLAEKGAMYHRIDLTDHEDRSAPFAFYRESAEHYTPAIQSARGNRIRKSGWTAILSQIANVSYRYLADECMADAPLPNTIDPSVEYTDERDLRSAYLTVWAVNGTDTHGQ